MQFDVGSHSYQEEEDWRERTPEEIAEGIRQMEINDALDKIFRNPQKSQQSDKEIAEIVGCQESYVLSKRHDFNNKLKEKIICHLESSARESDEVIAQKVGCSALAVAVVRSVLIVQKESEQVYGWIFGIIGFGILAYFLCHWCHWL